MNMLHGSAYALVRNGSKWYKNTSPPERIGWRSGGVGRPGVGLWLAGHLPGYTSKALASTSTAL